MKVTTNSERLIAYRSKIIELFFVERNHICAVCVANKHCELQNHAQRLELTHFELAPLHPELPVDATHERFILDHNRCILCTRCVRVCDEVEGAHTWDIAGRGINARLVSDGGYAVGQFHHVHELRQMRPGVPDRGLVGKGPVRGRRPKRTGRTCLTSWRSTGSGQA